MTKDEFILGYCERSGITLDWLSKHQVALPCACGDESCDGWAMVSKSSESIKSHRELYAPVDVERSGTNLTAGLGGTINGERILK